MHTRSVKLALVLLLVVCLGSALPAWSQSTSTGTVAGSVTDPSNAVVPGATVTLTDSATNIARTTTTNKEGRYIFVDVTPGVYNIAVTKSGFATTKTEKQEVKVGAESHAQFVPASGRRECGRGSVSHRHGAADHECHRGQHGHGHRHRQPAQHRPRCQHLHRIATGRKRRWRRCGRGERPKLFLAGWRQQHQRHGWQRRRIYRRRSRVW